ncbi:hypothetical protein IWQ60_010241 [Tieghemiomyces parasiticus]|uniref:Uncharacterized protein n=1 Tax=Tieghemiomyces parasiticus TaxID=78921 RepID=A0A9W7ZLP6_9FUNG|nr:hypothetical protein IWQ60_010241 [Tieghemiomyces parasiticus]
MSDIAVAKSPDASHADQRLAKRVKTEDDTSTNLAGETARLSIVPADIATTGSPVQAQEPTSPDHVFRNLRLRRILRENHGRTISQIAFFLNAKHHHADTPVGLNRHKTFDRQGAVERDEDDTSNLLATVGDTQVSVYDNEHCGDHLDIMSNFRLAPPVSVAGDDEVGATAAAALATEEFLTCCWISQPEDAWLAAAGQTGTIHLLSLAYSRELHRLTGHTGAVTDLQTHPRNDHYLLSASKDGTVRLWDLRVNRCVCVFRTNTHAVIQLWDLPEEFHSDQVTLPDPDATCEPQEATQSREILKYRQGLSEAIICIRQLADGFVFSNGCGMLVVADREGNILQELRVKNNGLNKCRFDVSLDGRYLCAGNSQGVVYVFDLTTGKTVTELRHKRSVKAVKTCVFTLDCRSVLYAGDDGFLWRYDYISDEMLQEWAAKRPTI